MKQKYKEKHQKVKKKFSKNYLKTCLLDKLFWI